jgi:hypothetical protein
MFRNWLRVITKHDYEQIQVGVCAILWAIWNVRNVINKLRASSFFADYHAFATNIGSLCGPNLTSGATISHEF